MEQWLAEAFHRYGYGVLVVGIYLESLGIPVPGETVLLAAAFFARQGALSIGWVIAVTAVTAVLGDNTGYWIGRRFGRKFLERHGRWVGLTEERLAALDKFYDRHGIKTVLFARFLSGVRVVAALFAGVSGIDWQRFAVWNAVGGVSWAVVVGLVGYEVGKSWAVLGRWMGRGGLLALVLLAAVVLIRLALRRRDERGEKTQPSAGPAGSP